MVFIHGGGYAYGGSHDTELDGGQLVQYRGSVIVVTLNYRVDILGFLGGEALRSRDPTGSTGNYGIQDQRAAMEWVQTNIHAFGGDAKKVMIYGESAGAGSVSNHVVMKKSFGLFERAAMQSGGFQQWVAKSMKDAQKNYNQAALNLGCDGQDEVACMLGKKPWELFVGSEYSALPQLDSWDACRWAPTIDGVEMEVHPMVALANGDIAPTADGKLIPIILGTNKDEGTSFIGYNKIGDLPKSLPKLLSAKAFLNWATAIWGESAATKMVDIYPLTKRPSFKNWHQATLATGDYMMTCPNRMFGRLYANKQKESGFVYFFSEMPGNKTTDEGVFHGAEIRFVFHISDELNFGPADDEILLSGQMVCYWANFAETGDPNRPEDCNDKMGKTINWSPFSQLDNGTNVRIQLPASSIENGLRDTECDFWDDIVANQSIYKEMWESNSGLKEAVTEPWVQPKPHIEAAAEGRLFARVLELL